MLKCWLRSRAYPCLRRCAVVCSPDFHSLEPARGLLVALSLQLPRRSFLLLSGHGNGPRILGDNLAACDNKAPQSWSCATILQPGRHLQVE